MTETISPVVRRSLRGRIFFEYQGEGIATGVGPIDMLGPAEVLALLPEQPIWLKPGNGERQACLRGADRIMEWLLTFPGEGWQERWQNAGADASADWIDKLTADDLRTSDQSRREIRLALPRLLAARFVLPGYDFLTDYGSLRLFRDVRAVISPDLFVRAEQVGAEIGMKQTQLPNALNILTKVVLRTGKNLDQVTPEDLFGIRAWRVRARDRHGHTAANGAWDLLAGVGIFPEHSSMREAMRMGQRPTAELVDRYQIKSTTIREVLIRYFEERRPALDYASFRGQVTYIAGTFWADIEAHHPGIDSLDLAHDVAAAWKERARIVVNPDGTRRERASYLDVLVLIRAFYQDIQQWALDDASWAPFAVPSPIRRNDTAGLSKARKAATAKMHQRTRERLPHLPILIDTTTGHVKETREALAAGAGVTIGETFVRHGTAYRRVIPKSYRLAPYRATDHVQVEDLASGTVTDLTRNEDDAFWSWAVIETLRLTGVRIEELLELTQLAIISYRLPDTGEVVPLLQIVPSKTDRERLLLVPPELASVLASIITRIRGHDGRVPLVARHDTAERITGPRLPHLFQRRYGWQNAVISTNTVINLIDAALVRAGLTDTAGDPLCYRPHDFRRMFTTEIVTGGLPIHIAARILGHENINTTQAYHAVFPEELIRTYRAFTDQRRAMRPSVEYREPTDAEWTEFQQHFQLRKLELGTCGRPYGTPCNHEHACIRCPMLRPDPAQRTRLVEIIENLTDRKAEAIAQGWLAEVGGLETSLTAAQAKLTSLDRIATTSASSPVLLGIPLIREEV